MMFCICSTKTAKTLRAVFVSIVDSELLFSASLTPVEHRSVT
jgi:hypothetical protein